MICGDDVRVNINRLTHTVDIKTDFFEMVDWTWFDGRGFPMAMAIFTRRGDYFHAQRASKVFPINWLIKYCITFTAKHVSVAKYPIFIEQLKDKQLRFGVRFHG